MFFTINHAHRKLSCLTIVLCLTLMAGWTSSLAQPAPTFRLVRPAEKQALELNSLEQALAQATRGDQIEIDASSPIDLHEGLRLQGVSLKGIGSSPVRLNVAGPQGIAWAEQARLENLELIGRADATTTQTGIIAGPSVQMIACRLQGFTGGGVRWVNAPGAAMSGNMEYCVVTGDSPAVTFEDRAGPLPGEVLVDHCTLADTSVRGAGAVFFSDDFGGMDGSNVLIRNTALFSAKGACVEASGMTRLGYRYASNAYFHHRRREIFNHDRYSLPLPIYPDSLENPDPAFENIFVGDDRLRECSPLLGAASDGLNIGASQAPALTLAPEKILTVRQDGKQGAYQTIQAALEKSKPGDRIQIKQMEKPFEVEGLRLEGVSLYGPTEQRATLLIKSPIGIKLSGGAELRNLELVGEGLDASQQTGVLAGEHATIRYCALRGFSDCAVRWMSQTDKPMSGRIERSVLYDNACGVRLEHVGSQGEPGAIMIDHCTMHHSNENSPHLIIFEGDFGGYNGSNVTVHNTILKSDHGVCITAPGVANLAYRHDNNSFFYKGTKDSWNQGQGSNLPMNLGSLDNLDPCFVDEAQGDHQLRTDSPCIGSGMCATTIGAWEWPGGPTDHWDEEAPYQVPREGEMERIVAAADGWTFETAQSHQRFVPFGANMVFHDPPAGATVNSADNAEFWGLSVLTHPQWHPEKIDRAMAAARSLNMNLVKVFLPSGRILPDPQPHGAFAPAHMDPPLQERLDTLFELAHKHHLYVLLTLTEWELGRLQWWRQGGLFLGRPEQAGAGPDSLRVLRNFWQAIARRYKDEPALFAYDQAVEYMALVYHYGPVRHGEVWSTCMYLDEWWGLREWQRQLSMQNDTINSLNERWGTRYSSFDDIRFPDFTWIGEKQSYGSPQAMATDFNDFREFVSYRYFNEQTKAIRAIDSKHMITAGTHPLHPAINWQGAASYLTGVSPAELEMFDFTTLHVYTQEGNGKNGVDEKRLHRAVVEARFAYGGRPVLVEEMGHNAQDGQETMNETLKLLEALQPHASGFMLWFLNDVNPDYGYGPLDSDFNMKEYGQRWKALVEPGGILNDPPRARQAAQVTHRIPRVEAMAPVQPTAAQQLVDQWDSQPKPQDFVIDQKNPLIERYKKQEMQK